MVFTRINNIIGRLVGYKIHKYVEAPKQPSYRDALKDFLLGKSSLINGRVLEIGPGTWTFVEDMLNDIEGVSYEAIDQAPRNENVRNISLYDMDVKLLEKYDVIIACDVFEHVENPFKAIKKVHVMLKENGLFLASTPFKKILHGEEYGDYWRITRQGWKFLLKDFAEVDVNHFREKLFPYAYFVHVTK